MSLRKALSSADATTSVDERIPKRFALYQNVPNPFNPSTLIAYDVPEGGARVTLGIYDVTGRLVREFVKNDTPGRKRFVWDGRSNAGDIATSGVYFYRLAAGSFVQTRKMVLIR